MPLHDWTRVKSGTYHNFHFHWIAALTDRLNDGRLPSGCFAMVEPWVGSPEPDIVTLPSREPVVPESMTANLDAPRAAVIEKAERHCYARKARQIAVHHGLGTVIAIIELVSPGNKDTKHTLQSFTKKSAALIRRGIHLLVIDPFPPGRYDPHGIHPAIWTNLEATQYHPPADKPLTLASYHALDLPTAYVEPAAVGVDLPDMPLFLDDEFYVNVPLEETYADTWAVLPHQIRDLFA